MPAASGKSLAIDRRRSGPWGHAAPCETQALLTQTLEQALLIQAETPAAWRAAWIDQAREALGKPA